MTANNVEPISDRDLNILETRTAALEPGWFTEGHQGELLHDILLAVPRLVARIRRAEQHPNEGPVIAKLRDSTFWDDEPGGLVGFLHAIGEHNYAERLDQLVAENAEQPS